MAQSLGAMKAVPLAVAGAFHTEIMRPADQRCAEALAEVPMRKAAHSRDLQRRRPARTTIPKKSGKSSSARFSSRCAGKIRCGYLIAARVRSILRGGPGRVLRGLLRRIDRNVVVPDAWRCERAAGTGRIRDRGIAQLQLTTDN